MMDIKTYKIKRKNKYYHLLYSLFKSPSNIIFLCVIYYCCVSLILAGADCTHLHSRSLLNFCLLFLIMLQAAFTSALISFPFNVLYNPRLILFPLNSYLFCFFWFSSYTGNMSLSRKLLLLVYDSSWIISVISCNWFFLNNQCYIM